MITIMICWPSFTSIRACQHSETESYTDSIDDGCQFAVESPIQGRVLRFPLTRKNALKLKASSKNDSVHPPPVSCKQKKKTSSPKGNDRSPESHYKSIETLKMLKGS